MRYSLSWQRMIFVAAALTVGFLIISLHSVPDIVRRRRHTKLTPVASERSKLTDLVISHRKLLSKATVEIEPNRIWGDKCSKSDIVISQGPTPPLPNGIPTYTVEIMNVCATGCDISGIHLSCRWFSSARLINPRIFKRIRYDDCLVNDGKPLPNGRTLSFQYANTFRYPLSVSSVKC